MGIDWEEILGVEGDELADAYERHIHDEDDLISDNDSYSDWNPSDVSLEKMHEVIENNHIFLEEAFDDFFALSKTHGYILLSDFELLHIFVAVDEYYIYVDLADELQNELIEGYWEPKEKTVQIFNSWANYKFSDIEISTLLKGETISFVLHLEHNKTYPISGKLEELVLPDFTFVYFKPNEQLPFLFVRNRETFEIIDKFNSSEKIAELYISENVILERYQHDDVTYCQINPSLHASDSQQISKLIMDKNLIDHPSLYSFSYMDFKYLIERKIVVHNTHVYELSENNTYGYPCLEVCELNNEKQNLLEYLLSRQVISQSHYFKKIVTNNEQTTTVDRFTSEDIVKLISGQEVIDRVDDIPWKFTLQNSDVPHYFNQQLPKHQLELVAEPSCFESRNSLISKITQGKNILYSEDFYTPVIIDDQFYQNDRFSLQQIIQLLHGGIVDTYKLETIQIDNNIYLQLVGNQPVDIIRYDTYSKKKDIMEDDLDF